MSGASDYYERYWADPMAAPPLNDPTTPVRKQMLRDALAGLPQGARVLDAGCGGGDFSEVINSFGYTATGTDLSESAIRFARNRFPKLDFAVGGPETLLPDHAGKFAAAWSSEVIEHVYDVYGFLCAVHECLAPGGILVLTTPYHGLIKNIVIDLFNYAKHYDPFAGHIRFFDKRSLDRVLRHCGFTPIKWMGYGRPWPLYKSFFVVASKTHKPSPPAAADG